MMMMREERGVLRESEWVVRNGGLRRWGNRCTFVGGFVLLWKDWKAIGIVNEVQRGEWKMNEWLGRHKVWLVSRRSSSFRLERQVEGRMKE